MASLPMSQQVQALQARVAELEQENRSLRLDLETCQRPHRLCHFHYLLASAITTALHPFCAEDLSQVCV